MQTTRYSTIPSISSLTFALRDQNKVKVTYSKLSDADVAASLVMARLEVFGNTAQTPSVKRAISHATEQDTDTQLWSVGEALGL